MIEPLSCMSCFRITNRCVVILSEEGQHLKAELNRFWTGLRMEWKYAKVLGGWKVVTSELPNIPKHHL